jgi:hypothetical protein
MRRIAASSTPARFYVLNKLLAIVMHRIGGGGDSSMGGFSGGADDKRWKVELFLAATNLFNHTNLIGYSGVMTSPFFGQPTSAGAAPGRGRGAVRVLESSVVRGPWAVGCGPWVGGSPFHRLREPLRLSTVVRAISLPEHPIHPEKIR